MASYLLASDSDSEDVRIIQLIQELDEESEVEERNDALGRQSFTTLQKCTSAIRQLAYGLSPDALDEYLHMSEQTSVICLDNFCKCIIDLHKSRYMRSPTATDVARLYSAHEEKHGFKGMLGSIDFFDALKKGTTPSTPFEVNGHQYSKGYYLADGIYPDWATLIKGMSCPTDEPRKEQRVSNSGRDQDVVTREIRDRVVHDQLTEDLIEHIWNLPTAFRPTN
ncbi:uncharacterized protein [Rutidosis leptorrhynchoides]|uniref:uncharacterized protein n=1 Tax=Rutidosis leptorrhynchoides TaxID=125765 RepID=UPI003A9A1D4E